MSNKYTTPKGTRFFFGKGKPGVIILAPITHVLVRLQRISRFRSNDFVVEFAGTLGTYPASW